ncbi:hypothetical protein [Sphingomonas soli]|uniref:hypothetical protein n=1 Tax=Sphingomonas soli TaxID=266127 RepID=UPI00082C295F|nr:hypothetical protein [Sphingomonas soli]
MLSIGLMLALAQSATSPPPDRAGIAAIRAASCDACAPESWQFRSAKWYWWDGGKFTYYWHAGKIVRLPGTPARGRKPSGPPSMRLKLKPGPTVFPDRPQ